MASALVDEWDVRRCWVCFATEEDEPFHSGFGLAVAVGQQNGSTRFAFSAGLMKSKQAVQQLKCLAHNAVLSMSLCFLH